MVVVFLGLLGIIFGSFINALVWRLHEQQKLSGKKGAQATQRRQDLSILKGRSMCPDCGHELAAKDLVPVASWLALGGQCRYCHGPISWQYPAVEILTGALFALSYVWWPYALYGVGLFQFVLWFVFLVGFVALAVYDMRWFLLPNRMVFPLTGLAVVQVLVTAIWLHDLAGLWQSVSAAAVIFGLFWVLFQVSKGTWIGGGDVKLAITLGLLAGTPLKAFMVIFFASLIGTLASVPVFAKGKKALKVHIPFGPYLILATIIVVLYGTSIVNWYQRLLSY